MKVITVRVLKSNSKVNRQLIDFLDGCLQEILSTRHQLKFQYAKSDGKTRYPQAVINGSTYLGLTQIQNGVNKLRSIAVQQRRLLENDGRMSQARRLRDESDSDSDSDFGGGDLHAQMERFNRRRNKSYERMGIDPVQGMNDSPDNIEHEKHSGKSKKSKKKKSKKHSGGGAMPIPSEPNVESRKSGKKLNKVVERMQDDDIGGAYDDMGGHNKDDQLIENMFLNMQETQLSGI